jgi:hypothetical protein
MALIMTPTVLSVALLAALAATGGAERTRSPASKPHIVFLFCDNVGWSNLGYHREEPTKEVQTPVIDALVRTGVELDRMYTYKFCSPSRSSFLSGRLPVHVNIYNDDPARPGAGVPIGMTMISEKLAAEAGYLAHFIGKWVSIPPFRPLGRMRAATLLFAGATAACALEVPFNFSSPPAEISPLLLPPPLAAAAASTSAWPRVRRPQPAVALTRPLATSIRRMITSPSAGLRAATAVGTSTFGTATTQRET